MACQFGRRTVPPHGVSPEGDRLVCATPPFSRPSGGFTAVGITITQTQSRGGDGGGGARRGGRAVVSPRGAQSFEYVPAWEARAARPSEAGSVAWPSITRVSMRVVACNPFDYYLKNRTPSSRSLFISHWSMDTTVQSHTRGAAVKARVTWIKLNRVKALMRAMQE